MGRKVEVTITCDQCLNKLQKGSNWDRIVLFSEPQWEDGASVPRYVNHFCNRKCLLQWLEESSQWMNVTERPPL
jgi:hypothetical protein